RSELYAFIGLILIILEFFTSKVTDQKPVNITNIYNQYNIENVEIINSVPQFDSLVNRDLLQVDTLKKIYMPRPELQKKKKKRNRMCDCGSGKLFRHCHGFKK